MDFLFDPVFLAIFGTLFGGVTFKAIENFNSKAKEVESEQDKFNRKAAKKLGVKIVKPEPVPTGVYYCAVYESHTFERKLAEAGVISHDEITICDNNDCELCKPERNRRIAEFDKKRAEERYALRAKAAKTTKAEYEKTKWHPMKELGSNAILGHYRVRNDYKIEIECNGRRAITEHSQRPDYIHDGLAIQRPDKVSQFATARLDREGHSSITVRWDTGYGHMLRSDHLKPMKAKSFGYGCNCHVCGAETYGETCAPCNIETYEVHGGNGELINKYEVESKKYGEYIKSLENRLNILSETIDDFSYKRLPDPARSRGRG